MTYRKDASESAAAKYWRGLTPSERKLASRVTLDVACDDELGVFRVRLQRMAHRGELVNLDVSMGMLMPGDERLLATFVRELRFALAQVQAEPNERVMQVGARVRSRRGFGRAIRVVTSVDRTQERIQLDQDGKWRDPNAWRPA